MKMKTKLVIPITLLVFCFSMVETYASKESSIQTEEEALFVYGLRYKQKCKDKENPPKEECNHYKNTLQEGIQKFKASENQ